MAVKDIPAHFSLIFKEYLKFFDFFLARNQVMNVTCQILYPTIPSNEYDFTERINILSARIYIFI